MTTQPVDHHFPIKSIAKALIYFASVLSLFLVVHLTPNNLNRLLRRAARSDTFHFIDAYSDAIRDSAPSLKAFIFGCALIVVCLPICVDSYRRAKEASIAKTALNILSAVVISLILAFFVFRPGVDSMGTNYAIIADSPFTQPSSFHNTKLLMPALAYFLSLRSFRAYYAFSVALTVTFIALLYPWLKENTELKAWQIVSLCTCSFVLYQYQYGGYPDILVFICYVLAMQKFMSSESKLVLLVLAMVAHESSIFVGAILAWRYLSGKHLAIYIGTVIAYFVTWFLALSGNLDALLASRNVEGMSGLAWAASAPINELLGILVSFKAIWLAIGWATWIALRKGLYEDALFILACVSAGILMTFLGVDTSRLMGFSFPGVLIALSNLSHQPEMEGTNRALSMIFLLNLILPSFYIGLNGGMEFFPGLYRYLYGWMAALVA